MQNALFTKSLVTSLYMDAKGVDSPHDAASHSFTERVTPVSVTPVSMKGPLTGDFLMLVIPTVPTVQRVGVTKICQ